MTRPEPTAAGSMQKALRGLVLLLFAVGSVSGEVVLLRNGSVIEGEAHVSADRVRIVQADGELSLRGQEVATVTATLSEAYEWLRVQQDKGARSAEESLDLAEWCLRHELLPEASRELLEARVIAPRSERLRLLERRAMMLNEAAAEPAPREQAPAKALAAASLGTAADEPSSLKLPHGGLQQFSRRIQPLLVNNCTGSGCHASDDRGAFALDRRMLYGYADARSTQQNLRAALSAIDVSDPEASALLDALRGAHHGAPPLRGPRRDELVGRLQQWVTQVAMANGWRHSEATDIPLENVSSDPAVAQASYEEPIEAPADESPPLLGLAPATLKRGGALRAVEPRDEFDPEIFNRRHRRPEDDLPDPADKP